MRSWKLGEIAGIGVFVHWSFLILPLLVAISSRSAGLGWGATVTAIAFILAVFGCVVLHELGHALMARRFGIQTRNITLLPIGGVANLDRMPERPRDELAVALAGPAINVGIAMALLSLFALAGDAGFVLSTQGLERSFLVRLFWANVGLVVFNLLPAFPMDGGRVLRALLATQTSYLRATNLATRVGQLMAILFAVAGLFGHWMLVFVALFVFLAGRAEASAVRSKAMLERFSVRDAMQRTFHMVPAEISLAEAAQATLFTAQEDFPVIDQGQLVGMLTRQRVLQSLADGLGHLPVSTLMRRDIFTLDQDAPLADSLDRMQLGNHRSLPVAHGGQLVGVITIAAMHQWLAAWAARPQALVS
jgi:Zn-dependent protease/predicted transcriptional regulator